MTFELLTYIHYLKGMVTAMMKITMPIVIMMMETAVETMSSLKTVTFVNAKILILGNKN